ncbi:hypothetical protein PU976_02705 [Staphylococcus aureus]|nr:hypothetical protein PU976_02705 [Staphylococcus aureus]WFO00053.1 hypothetical protein PD502_02940 [Staphylococcus aureus]WFO02212.1 hypothetical protein PEB16_02470 [Staphylococcus aureus]WFO06353.1 hypothetical protein PEB67_02575 [Staphylococcus aureus]WFO08514.1 hypothetical protein P9A63_02585 [Staphylococcus aureus]
MIEVGIPLWRVGVINLINAVNDYANEIFL